MLSIAHDMALPRGEKVTGAAPGGYLRSVNRFRTQIRIGTP